MACVTSVKLGRLFCFSVSDLALEESQELREKYEAEVACRKKAEEYATQVIIIVT